MSALSFRVYSAAKSVVDSFRFRNKFGIDLAVEALGNLMKRRGNWPADVMKVARLCRMERTIKPYLEALQ